MGGLPPFLGFLPKWLTINYIVENNNYILSCILIIFTLLSLYFYLRITFSTFTIYTKETLVIILKKINSLYFIINFLSLSGLLTCSILNSIF